MAPVQSTNRKAGGTGKKGKKFVEGKSALLSLIDDLPKFTQPRNKANQAEQLAPDDHMNSTNDDARGIISFETDDKKKKKAAAQKKKGKNAQGGKKAQPVDDGLGRLIKTAKGKEKDLGSTSEEIQDAKNAQAGVVSESEAAKKKVVDRIQEKKRELAETKAAIAAKEKQRKKQNKMIRTGQSEPEGTKKKRSVGFAL